MCHGEKNMQPNEEGVLGKILKGKIKQKQQREE